MVSTKDFINYKKSYLRFFIIYKIIIIFYLLLFIYYLLLFLLFIIYYYFFYLLLFILLIFYIFSESTGLIRNEKLILRDVHEKKFWRQAKENFLIKGIFKNPSTFFSLKLFEYTRKISDVSFLQILIAKS